MHRRHACTSHAVKLWCCTCRGTQTGFGKVVLGDVITAVGGQRIVSVEDLVSAIEQFSIGDRVPLSIKRDGRQLDIQVPLLAEQKAVKPY